VIPHAKLKSLFFDRAAVINAMDAKTRRVLSRFGAFVRRRDRSSQRRRKKVSDPGSPPSAHVGLIKEMTYFAYEPESKSVIVGPAFLNRPQPGVLVLIEKGGDALRAVHGKPKRLHYRARPHTGPAFEAELPKLPGMWGK
jgi:hypothetical protein